MARSPLISQVSQAAKAVTRRTLRRLPASGLLAAVQSQEERTSPTESPALQRARAEADKLRRQTESLRRQAEKLRGQVEALRRQRDEAKGAKYALSALGQSLGLAPESTADAKLLQRRLALLRAEASLSGHLLEGRPLNEALVATVRALLVDPHNLARARALCTVLMDDERTRPAGAVGLGLYLFAWGTRQNANEAFSQAPHELLARTAPRESVTCALAVDAATGRQLAQAILREPDLAPAKAVEVAGVLFGHHELDLARRTLARAHTAAPLEGPVAKKVERLERWLAAAPAQLDTVAPPRQRPTLGLLHYDHPEYARASANLGDYTQTVAFLGHLLRRRGLKLHVGDADLQAALDELRRAISADLMFDTSPAEVDLVPISRDASRLEAVPEPTWTIAFGAFMHSLFNVRHELPLHRSIRPIFLSLHVTTPDILTPETLDYLRRYGPVGCRDWATADLLMSHGVDAFFSGCLTTTTYITGGRWSPDAATAEPDSAQADAVLRTPSQVSADVRDRTLAANLLAAHEHHLTLRGSRETPLQTSRLLEYLPATSMGVPVEFEPRNPSDIRFEGLSGLAAESPDLRDMQERTSALLDAVIEQVVAGADEATVYASWREATRELVEQARSRREHWRTTHPPVETFTGVAGPVRDSAVHLGSGGDVHVAIALDHNLVAQAAVVLQGIEENTRRDVRVHVLTRGVPLQTIEAWARTFSRLRFSHYRFDDVVYGASTGLLSHTTVSTMDRLLLPDILDDLGRVVYIDIDVAVLGDVGELWDLDLDGAPLAARPTASEWAESGLGFINRAAMRLPTDLARELRAFMYARLDGDFVAFNAGVLVLNLDRMRADGFGEHFAGMAGRYGLNDQDVLCCYAATEALKLDTRWNTFPTRETVPADVRLLHFAGKGKPWDCLPLPAKQFWTDTRDRCAARLDSSASSAEAVV